MSLTMYEHRRLLSPCTFIDSSPTSFFLRHIHIPHQSEQYLRRFRDIKVGPSRTLDLHNLPGLTGVILVRQQKRPSNVRDRFTAITRGGGRWSRRGAKVKAGCLGCLRQNIFASSLTDELKLKRAVVLVTPVIAAL